MKIQSSCTASVLGLVLSLCLTGCAGSSNNGSSGSAGSSGSSGSGTSAPTVSSVAPASLTAGAASTALTVTGTGFTASTAVQVGSAVETTTYVSSTQVTATVPAAQLAQGTILPVIALNGSFTSASGTPVDLIVNNPAPVIAAAVPAALPVGSPSTSVAFTGTGFVPTTIIQVGGTARATTFVSSTEVSAILTPADLATAGTLAALAVNPTPGGGTSATTPVSVNNPAPAAIVLAPATVPAGAATASSIAVTGTGFVASSVVQVNGTSRTTAYVSATQLTFQLTVADQATVGNLAVTVTNPAPGGGSSASATLIVAAPVKTPVIVLYEPKIILVGSPDTVLSMSGLNFSSSTPVEWNGSPLSTQYTVDPYGNEYLFATVPASLLTAPGTASVTVYDAASTPTTSNTVTVTVSNPPVPTVTYFYPTSGPINTATAVTIDGTGFTPASTAQFNGTTIPSTFVNSTQLTATIPASTVTLPGNGGITVTTPAPGGGTSAAQIFTAYIGLLNNSMVYNPANGLFYASVPSAAGAPYGNSIVSVDPETGALGTPIPVGSEPNKLALSSDGTILWVGLDGAAAVRQVNLTTGTAGLQFSLGGNSGIYAAPGTAVALAALPGAPNSVVVSAPTGLGGQTLAIFDSGVLRGTPSTSYPYQNEAYALQVDGTRSEVYAGGSSYQTYTYSSSGLTPLATGAGSNYASYSADEMQIASGRLYTDFGTVLDAESGALLGTYYNNGVTVGNTPTAAVGPTVADTTLGKVFILDNSLAYAYNQYNQIQIFDVSDFNPATNAVIPLSLNTVPTSANPNPSRLTRWGTNGLALRNPAGIYSFRSNLVKDLSTTSADLGLALTAAGSNTTGSSTTWTATVTNAGPSASTNIAFTAQIPANGVLGAVTASAGTCSASSGISCDLGGLASGASTTVTIAVLQTTAGSQTLSAQVSGSENDPAPTNNQASSTLTVTGSAYNQQPTLTALAPQAIETGAGDTIITLTGTGFASTSTVLLNGQSLATSYTSPTTLTATVPAASLNTLGWGTITVSSPAPGGGASTALPLTIYQVLTVGLNHIVYDPYSRNLIASVGSGSSSVTGNSIVAITPDTATIGTPVPIGSQPTYISLTSDSDFLYTLLSGSQSVARFNLQTQASDATFTLNPSQGGVFTPSARWIAAQPETDTTVAVDLGEDEGNAIYDIDPTAGTGTIRGAATGSYTGSCLAFTDPADMFSFDVDTTGNTLDHYTVTSAGFSFYNFQQYTQSTLNHFSCFKLNGGLAFSIFGGVANPTPTPAVQVGTFAIPSGYNGEGDVAPDASLQRTFFAVNSTSGYSTSVDSIESFDQNTWLSTGFLPLAFASIEGTGTSFSVPDLVRWGQDGLAALTSTGHLYLLRGAAVVPGELVINLVATLASSSSSTLAHASGNTLLTLTGSNFLPGVAVDWNGSYRTTTIVDATHVTVAIPAGDLTIRGTASLTAINPGAPASRALTITID